MSLFRVVLFSKGALAATAFGAVADCSIGQEFVGNAPTNNLKVCRSRARTHLRGLPAAAQKSYVGKPVYSQCPGQPKKVQGWVSRSRSGRVGVAAKRGALKACP